MSGALRAVLVGCGRISATWLDALRDIPGVEVVGFVDVDEAAARERAAEYGPAGVVIGTDLATTLARTAPDLVFDCAVPEAHGAVTRAALAHGCHVLGEKPLAATMDEARELVAAAAGAGRLFAVMQNRRYDRGLRRLRAFVASGALGPLTTIGSDFYVAAHFGGFRDRMRHPLLLDMAIHTFDAARALAGADPRAVFCREWNPVGSWYAHGAAAVAHFELEGGIVYGYRGSWCAEGLNTAWEAEWRIVGERGSVLWDGGDGFRAEVVAGQRGIRSDYRAVPVPPYEGEAEVGGHAGAIRDFVRCVREGAIPETICGDNIKSLAMVFGAIESAERGALVSIAP